MSAMGMTHTVTAAAPGRGHWRMPLFVLVSLLLHLALLLLQQESVQAPLLLGEQTPLRVALQQQTQPVQQQDTPVTAPTNAAAPHRAAAEKSVVPVPTSSPALPAPQEHVPAETVAAPAAASPGAEDRLAALRSPLSARVGIELARHFHYPAIAQRRGWQGIVLLGFRVSMEGNIEAIHIARSSGHALLDRAAIGALHKVHRVMLDGHSLPQALELQLPVIYRLENG